jgi:murein DD-endopeptidase MepM/ murein hydrolase activator NlpD
LHRKILGWCLLATLAMVFIVSVQIKPAAAPAPQYLETQAPEIPKPHPVVEYIKPLKPEAHLSSIETAPGDFFTVYIHQAIPTDEIFALTNFSAKPVTFFPYGEGMISLVAVSYTTSPDDYHLEIKLFRDDWLYWQEKLPLTIVPKDFIRQDLRVTASQNAVRTSDNRYDDWAQLAKSRSVTYPEPLWVDDFMMPVEGKITTEFGLTRYVNNSSPTRHSGLDIAAPTGTPILATNSGKVTLAKDLYVPGNTVVIDHGLNLFSTYHHLNTILVQEGDFIEKGAPIGTVGSTGFSTGPHLHWTMTIGTTAINPWQILQGVRLKLLNI